MINSYHSNDKYNTSRENLAAFWTTLIPQHFDLN